MMNPVMFIKTLFCLPCTGERADFWPYIIGAGLLVFAILLIILKTRKNKNDEDSLNDK